MIILGYLLDKMIKFLAQETLQYDISMLTIFEVGNLHGEFFSWMADLMILADNVD